MTEQYFLQLNNNTPNRIKLGLEVRGETIFARLEAVTRNDSETITNGLIDNSVSLLELKPEFANNKIIKKLILCDAMDKLLSLVKTTDSPIDKIINDYCQQNLLTRKFGIWT